MKDLSLFDSPKKVKLIWVLLLLFAAESKAQMQCVSIDDSIATIPEYGSAEQRIDRINLSSFKFSKIPGRRINFGMVGNGYNYILLKLKSESACDGQYLSIDNTSIDTVSIYRIYNDGISRLLYQGGDLVPFKNQRDYVWHTAPVEISQTPSFYLIALKASQKNINIRYEILEKDELQKKYQGYDRLVFFYTGIVSLIITIILLAFFLFRKVVFAVYLGYIICLSGWILSHYGYVFPFLYPRLPQINEIAKPISSLGASFFLMAVLNGVFRQSLQSRRWLKQTIKWMLYILPLLILSMLLLLVRGLGIQAKAGLITGWHIGLVFSIFLIVLTPVNLINFSSTAKIFSAAMLVICIMSIMQLIANSGHISNFFISEHGMTIGSLVEISIMAFGLFYSLLEEKKLKEKQVLALEHEQSETLKKLIAVQDNERKRIACDLHDNIGPLLAALKINFRRLIRAKEGDIQNDLVAKTESIIDDSIAEIRNVAHNLMPKGLSSKGLINTLNEYFESIQLIYSKTLVFNHQIESIFHPDLQINIYRVICELVLNAARHSNARLITVRIVSNEKQVFISIQDDGQGFQRKPGDQKNSLGFQSAESRVLYLKGKFTLKTEPGRGTAIEMEIPLQFYETHINSF